MPTYEQAFQQEQLTFKGKLVERLRLIAGFLDNMPMTCIYCSHNLSLNHIIQYLSGFDVVQLRNLMASQERVGVLCCNCIKKAGQYTIDYTFDNTIAKRLTEVEAIPIPKANEFVNDLLYGYMPHPRPRLKYRYAKLVNGKIRYRANRTL